MPGDIGGLVTAGRLHQDLLVPEAYGGRVQELGRQLPDLRVDDRFGEDGIAPVRVIDLVQGVGIVAGAPEAGQGFAAGFVAPGVDLVHRVG